MTTAKYLGIWMDHASAHIIDLIAVPMTTKVIKSKFTHQVKEHSLAHSENVSHNTEQHLQAEYYKEIADVIRNFKHVLLFGPTGAKTELHNILKADHRFADIRIEIRTSDKMTDNQQHAFVKAYFSNH